MGRPDLSDGVSSPAPEQGITVHWPTNHYSKTKNVRENGDLPTMATPNITLARYKIMLGELNGAAAIVIQATQTNANLPAHMQAFYGFAENRKTIQWQTAEVVDDQGDGRVDLRSTGTGSVFHGVLQPMDEFFHGSPGGTTSQKRALAATLPPMNDPPDILMAAYNQVTAAFMRNYQGAAVQIENEEIVVSSDTALASRTPTGAAPKVTGGAGPKRPKTNRENIRVWI